jgi:hypothetical protein
VFNAIIENWLNKEMVAGMSERELVAASAMMQRIISRTEFMAERDEKGYL